MRCQSCSALIPAKTRKCTYCGALNPIDLEGVHYNTTEAPRETRTCPDCETPLLTINIRKEGTFLIERCEKCYGLFFDVNELGALVDALTKHVFSADPTQFDTVLNESHVSAAEKILYRKCPVCQKHMNRQNYGLRSGVIVDSCRDHGTWLKGGELTQILHWTKVGGEIHSSGEISERERLAQIEKERKARFEKLQEDLEKNYGTDTTSDIFSFLFKG